MNVAELKKRILRGFAFPELFYLPAEKKKETRTGSVTIGTRIPYYNVDTEEFDTSWQYWAWWNTQIVVKDMNGKIVYLTKKGYSYASQPVNNIPLINPVRSTNSMNEFITVIDSVFGENIGSGGDYDDVHFLDEAHSLGFRGQNDQVQLFVGTEQIFTTYTSSGDKYRYIISQKRNALYFGWFHSSSNYVVIVAAKASNGKWNIFYKVTNYKKLYYNAPNPDFVVCEPALKTSQANTPYIISPYPDLNGGVMSELFRVDYLSAFDPLNPPVLTAGDCLYAVMPYPLHDSETAAFAMPIDPADYEEG